ncbi:NADH-quinone oxidoreductase subunit NuoK [Oligoflexus tunisiensis]|uniref:NADH-quinone oxidoreductase subunit NuoK n=1 Tax=Oligoflexus tunisiensis TaxID=708132 RepID=UPI000AD4486D|nr:NADH-quinone oxidoreductase subunit NuoK [Oligoflexus tunisiensis]
MDTGVLLHILSAWLFCMGLLAICIRRNTLVMLMGIELMLNGVNLSFVAFAHELQQLVGQLQVFFIITVAAAESAVGLSILVNVYRNFGSIKTDRTQTLRG